MLKLIFKLFLDSSQYKRELKDAGKDADKAARGMQKSLGSTLGKFFTAGLVLKGIQALTRALFDQAEVVNRLQKEFKLTAQEATKLSQLATKFGTTPETMAKVLEQRGGVKSELAKQQPAVAFDETDIARLRTFVGSLQEIGRVIAVTAGTAASAGLGKAAKFFGIDAAKEKQIVDKYGNVQAKIGEVEKGKQDSTTLGRIMRDKDMLARGVNPRASVGAFIGNNPLMSMQAEANRHLRQIVINTRPIPKAASSQSFHTETTMGIPFIKLD